MINRLVFIILILSLSGSSIANCYKLSLTKKYKVVFKIDEKKNKQFIKSK